MQNHYVCKYYLYSLTFNTIIQGDYIVLDLRSLRKRDRFNKPSNAHE